MTSILSFHDERLTAATAASCDLYMVAGGAGCSLLVCDAEGSVWALRRWNPSKSPGSGPRSDAEALSDLRSVLTREVLFGWPFRRVRWAWYNAQATLVPRRLFQAEDLPAYFKLLLQPADYVYGYDELPEMECFVAYALHPDWVQIVEQFVPQAIHTHFAHPLLRSWYGQAPTEHYTVFLHIHYQSAQVAVFDRNNLVFYNAFVFHHANDLLYFSLLAYEQFRLSPMEIPLVISGNLLEDSEGWRTLYRYVRHLKFVEMPHLLRWPMALKDWPEHCQWDVFCLKNI